MLSVTIPTHMKQGFILRFLVSVVLRFLLVLVSVYLGCPFEDTRNINPTSYFSTTLLDNDSSK